MVSWSGPVFAFLKSRGPRNEPPETGPIVVFRLSLLGPDLVHSLFHVIIWLCLRKVTPDIGLVPRGLAACDGAWGGGGVAHVCN